MPYYGFLPLSGGTFTGASGAHGTIKFPDSTDGGAFSTTELMFKNSGADTNVMTVYNGDTAGLSVLTFRGDDKHEHMAIGWANSANGYLGGSLAFIEISDFPNVGQTTPPPKFRLARTGYIDGSYNTTTVMGFDGTSAGVMHFYTHGTGSSTSSDVMAIDPLNDYVTVQNRLLIGNLNNGYSPAVSLDNYGHGIIGSTTSNRSADGTFVLNLMEATQNQFRMVNAGNFKVDLLLNTSPFRLDFHDTDHSGVNPVSLAMDGSAKTTFGGPATLKSYTVSGLPSASTSGAGSLAFVTDGSTTAILGLGLTAVGGGANKYVVYSDGTNWIVI